MTIRGTWPLMLVLALFGGGNLAAQDDAHPERPPVTLRVVEAKGATLHYQNLPWGPQTFATMENAGDSFYNKRSWPFARLETTIALVLDGQTLPPGNYALVFVPASREQPAMSLEVRKVAAGEFFQEGNAMTRTPQGESLFKAPVVFERAAETLPALELKLDDADGGLTLRVAYGDRRLTRRFQRS